MHSGADRVRVKDEKKMKVCWKLAEYVMCEINVQAELCAAQWIETAKYE